MKREIEEAELKDLLRRGKLLTITDMYQRGWSWREMFTLLGHRTYQDPHTKRKTYYWWVGDVLRMEADLHFYIEREDG